jgi:hypothetical protein
MGGIRAAGTVPSGPVVGRGARPVPRPATRGCQPPAAHPAAATIAVVWISTW